MPKTKEKASDIKADIVEVESNELSAPSQEFVFDLEKMDIPYYSIKCSFDFSFSSVGHGCLDWCL